MKKLFLSAFALVALGGTGSVSASTTVAALGIQAGAEAVLKNNASTSDEVKTACEQLYSFRSFTDLEMQNIIGETREAAIAQCIKNNPRSAPTITRMVHNAQNCSQAFWGYAYNPNSGFCQSPTAMQGCSGAHWTSAIKPGTNLTAYALVCPSDGRTLVAAP